MRPGSTGANSGSDWNNAWSGSSISWSKVAAGDTVWLAGGSYSSGLSISKSGAAGNTIKIYRATGSDAAPKAAAGWSSSFDSQVQLPGTGLYIPSASHITVDGRTQYGILITISKGGGYGIQAGTTGVTSSDLTFRNIDVLGPYGSNGGQVIGWKMSPSTNTLSDLLFDHCRIRGVGTGLHCLASNVTVQYCTIQDVAPEYSGAHPDVMYCYPSPNMTWRYNSIINCTVDGVFFEYGGAVNFNFYGNLYYSTTNHLIAFKQGDTYGPVHIYNNTFQGANTSSYGYLTATGATMVAGSQVYNNIFYNAYNGLSGFSNIASDYNAYGYTSIGGFSWPSRETHSFTFAGIPFVSLPPHTTPATIGNFHLLPALQALFQRGITLAQDGYVNKDMDGNTRGAHGAWYVGAYEYGSGGSASPTPTPSATPKPTPTPTPAPGGAHSIFSTGATPAHVTWADSTPVQLGVKFQSSVAGTVSAIRFYKGPQNAAPHVVTLWNASGALLATATSSGETASGWQQVKLSTAVKINANTTYVVAYHTNGYYSADANFFANAVASSPLTALGGANGVFSYGSSTVFPSSSYQSTNYWVDVVFNQ